MCRFGISLWQDTEHNVVLHLSVPFFGSLVPLTVVSYKINSIWQNATVLQAPDNPFPFVEGQQFQLKITASGLNQLDVSLILHITN